MQGYLTEIMFTKKEESSFFRKIPNVGQSFPTPPLLNTTSAISSWNGLKYLDNSKGGCWINHNSKGFVERLTWLYQVRKANCKCMQCNLNRVLGCIFSFISTDILDNTYSIKGLGITLWKVRLLSSLSF